MIFGDMFKRGKGAIVAGATFPGKIHYLRVHPRLTAHVELSVFSPQSSFCCGVGKYFVLSAVKASYPKP